ncbi:MAG: hypothetical protein ACOZQL_10570 [Myxococcota bacterium]
MVASDAPRLEPLKSELRDGLKRMEALPVGGGYVDVLAGVDLLAGSTPAAFARIEVGAHPVKPLALFGFAETHFRGDLAAGVGARLSW